MCAICMLCFAADVCGLRGVSFVYLRALELMRHLDLVLRLARPHRNRWYIVEMIAIIIIWTVDSGHGEHSLSDAVGSTAHLVHVCGVRCAHGTSRTLDIWHRALRLSPK